MFRSPLFFIAAVLLAGTAAPQKNESPKTIWSGVYTSAQADRGKEQFAAHCAECHDGDLDLRNTASRLVGDRFMDRWREDSMSNLFNFVSTSMPRRAPASLTKAVYLDVVSYLLQLNSAPPGNDDLRAEVLDTIQVQRKDGPRPLPSGSLVQLVGCLNADPDETFMLTHASEPARSRRVNDATPEELAAAVEKELGTQTFRLENFAYLGKDFVRLDHLGHKMLAKGTLIRQMNKERVNLTYMKMIDSVCEP